MSADESGPDRQLVRIGGGAGYWGESDMALPQLLAACDIDYVVFDYLAEVTMSILARAKTADPDLGYATDFVSAVIKPNIAAIKSSGVRLISNAGGLNPRRCATAIRRLAAEAGISLRVAVVTGDDLLNDLEHVLDANSREMFSGEPLPARATIASANAYLGAFPIAQALASGADIVLTGRCVDSALVLGACIYEFGWRPTDLDLLAAGSLVGHLLECGPQVTGGNYTDWTTVGDGLWSVGYPIAEVTADGTAVITKPVNTGGAVTAGTVGEQLLYEIGDPAAYWLPDVICDFSEVEISEVGVNRVRVAGARGRGIPHAYKTSLTWLDGWRAGAVAFYVGSDAPRKARIYAEAAVRRAQAKVTAAGLGDYQEVMIEVVGDESHYGAYARHLTPREVAVKVACRHHEKAAVAVFLKELSGVALGAPPGLCAFAGARPKPSPVVRLFSLLVSKSTVPLGVEIDGVAIDCDVPLGEVRELPAVRRPVPEPDWQQHGVLSEVPLEQLAWARSGDKGDKASIGVMARKAEFLPWIAATLTSDYVAARFAHFIDAGSIERFYLPGLAALNFLIDRVLAGGGIASLRNDPQAKSYAQILLDTPIQIPPSLLES